MTRSQFQPGPATDHYHNSLGIENIPLEDLGSDQTVTILQRSLTLSHAQITTLSGSAYEVVPAIADAFIVPVVGVVVSHIVTPYTLSDSNPISLGLLDGFGNVLYDIPADLLENDGYIAWSPLQFDSVTPAAFIGTSGQSVNQPFQIGGGPIISGGGDPANTLKVTIWYGVFEV